MLLLRSVFNVFMAKEYIQTFFKYCSVRTKVRAVERSENPMRFTSQVSKYEKKKRVRSGGVLYNGIDFRMYAQDLFRRVIPKSSMKIFKIDYQNRSSKQIYEIDLQNRTSKQISKTDLQYRRFFRNIFREHFSGTFVQVLSTHSSQFF